MNKYAWKIVMRGKDPYEETHRFGLVEADSLPWAVHIVTEQEKAAYESRYAVQLFVELWRG